MRPRLLLVVALYFTFYSGTLEPKIEKEKESESWGAEHTAVTALMPVFTECARLLKIPNASQEIPTNIPQKLARARFSLHKPIDSDAQKVGEN